ncbi:glycosyltransferase family 4 protein [Sphingobacterium multivorum]|uniref:glycosyltransferase family 4 protein n=1 Tax=Sphingobacterium multivorum TaxID=28454 RepID=UPI0028B2061F|nr:glycosyltransferase family 4 protein [Sphingobacterium multivorum]
MKVLIDNSNLFAGGGIQVAASFLNDLKEMKLSHSFLIVLSPNAAKAISVQGYGEKFDFVILSEKEHTRIPSRIKAMRNIEALFNPDIIFTTFGPSYHKSSVKKIVGFAIGHIVYFDSPYFKEMNLFNLFKQGLINFSKSYYFKKNSDVLIFETGDALNRFKTPKRISKYEVSNTLNEVFLDKLKWVSLPLQHNSKFRILSVTANYPHKNIKIIPSIIDELLLKGLKDFEFLLTLDKSDVNFDIRYFKYIQFLGRVEHVALPSLYNASDVLLVTSMLEIFSTTYLEAMYMEVPIVTSNLPFANYICANAAEFCKYNSPSQYADSIIKLSKNKERYNELVHLGKQNLTRFGTSQQRTEKYLEIIELYGRK